ncbi:hypothetical protein HJA85_26985 [Rhizobium bangladeshense]|uniref:hypothetical protein n=1 Tax=Rhizobium TaxID=379 RepID=UPI001A91D5C1|nr:MULTISPECIES: hypothetical protein [Rhizobium]MBX4870570.1 hypothetical protein [Rhizobium bangladeshense]MBX4872715.1 hypothetical protein [Rhizobium bangladeshense]MBX5063330.1 hypothetical protein [Rhizobium lentis]MBX5075435.1 hypothetical protein [Rhizobium lentis]QSW93086.1 hypothetical protein J0663_18760 [Rhizobium lentis]
MINELLNRAAYLVDAVPRRLIGILFPETPKPEDYYWSKYDPIFGHPKVRLIDGTWSRNGQMWRRRNASGEWEYRQDPETAEEAMDRVI